ncbi:ABC transporter substrate-binding protein [Desulfogranum japonicum]|uniref:ABC transporter substrate-binding protein n=1 Tax=Desulfogranum japonicum TaxID=231447 RepID=UPI00041DD3D0|nr:ABC transporter substrate-binding protein [Desulfogranum japonicum]
MRYIVYLIITCLFTVVQTVYAESYTISVNQFVQHPALDAVEKGLEDYFRDNDIKVDFKLHNAQANMGTALQIAQQMIGEESDLLVAIATPSAQACAQALSRAPRNMQRPFLFTAVTDPIAAGLVRDLQKPGGKITGVSDLLPIREHIAMIMEFKPGIKKLGILYNAGEANSKSTVASIQELSSSMGFTLVKATASKTADVYQAAQSLVGKVDAVFIPTDNTIISALESVLKIGIENTLPIFAADVDSVERGAVAAMGFDYYKHGYQTGALALRILQGADPATTPVEFQKDLQLHINKQYAIKMGITPPEVLIQKAAKVYE